MLTFAAATKLSAGANGQKEDAALSSFLCTCSFDLLGAVMVAQWHYDLLHETRETVWNLATLVHVNSVMISLYSSYT